MIAFSQHRSNNDDAMQKLTNDKPQIIYNMYGCREEHFQAPRNNNSLRFQFNFESNWLFGFQTGL